ncbi:MSCRAMM family protein [Actinoplanes utahensis]|uniref:Alpha-amylase n=1 Tax=Actinoplanes utahensis TaxID=1869 RepID=A0A0A6US88_ACTUT|nr:carboxypeptidase-like regulatory domain-containing protein [Actinoplanes utahensis]KHD77848.1 hypothetical protein MB27_08645 [Actinoplanes utahensis]GIF32475.1 hypothetical protein Aut01nite_54610 [Actinoplanes utahensis]
MHRSFRALGLAILSGILAAGASATPAAADDLGVIAGTFTDRAGNPIPNAYTIIENIDGGAAEYTYTHPVGGDYQVPVAPGTYRVSFRWKGLTQWAHQQLDAGQANTFTVAAGETVQVSDQLVPSGTLNGHLTNADGTPLAYAWVSLWREGVSVNYTESDANGFYSFPAVLPGDYQVRFTSQYIPGTFTVVTDQSTTADGTLQPPPPSTTLVVKAVDAVSGEPAPGFCVLVAEREECGNPDADTVTMTRMPTGPISFTLISKGQYHLDKSGVTATLVENETTTITVPLVLGGTVQVAASDPGQFGVPVSRACFDLKVIGRPANVGSGCTGNNGIGWTQPVPAGTYTIFVDAPGDLGDQWLGENGGTGDQQTAARIVVEPGKTTQAPDVLLDRAGSITGVVTGTDGTPLESAHVNVLPAADHGTGDPIGVYTDASGRYLLDKLGPYSWPLQFEKRPDYPIQWSGNVSDRSQAVPIPVTAGATSTYDITLTKGATLRGALS